MAKKSLTINPWLSIWVKPRETIRKILRFNPRHRFVILSGLYGFPMLLHIAQNLSLGENFSALGIIVVSLILSIFVGMLGIVVATALLTWTGRWIGGGGSFINVRAAVTWSNVPNIFSVIVWLALIWLWGGNVFMEEFAEAPSPGINQAILGGAMVVQAVIAVWSFIMLIKGLGEAHGFSSWKGILNVLIPFFLVAILIWAGSYLFWAANGMPSPDMMPGGQ
ncbi:MAG: hypothetical protein K940chlam2_01006 [Chlamydiae bacterium]|nr:hypothetical protein [Chlamydiota bacterium]